MALRFTPVLTLLTMALIASCTGQEAVNNTPGKAVATDSSTVATLSLGKAVPIVYQDRDLNYWFVGNAEGVTRWNGEKLELFTRADGLASPSVLSVQEDDQGRIYFDTPEGVSVFDGHTFTTLKVTEKSRVDTVSWELEPGDLWFRIGWNGKGPYRFDGEQLYCLEFPEPERADIFYTTHPNAPFSPFGIYSIYTDSHGAIWFGTACLGACRYDGSTHDWLYEDALTNTPAGGSFGIRSIIEDDAGLFWICNASQRFVMLPGNTEKNGTSYLNYEKRKGFGPVDAEGSPESTPYFMSIAKDKNGDLWMATYENGVYCLRGEDITHYEVKDEDVQSEVFTAYCDQNNNIWLGTHNTGAMKFDGNKFSRFTPPK